MNRLSLEDFLVPNELLIGLENCIAPSYNAKDLPIYDPEKYKDKKLTPEEEALVRELMGDHWKIPDTSDASGGGGGRPPDKGENYNSFSDQYEKEKTELRRYFTEKVVSSVLKSAEDLNYAASAVRTLIELGIKLEAYEKGLPKDYKLEVLRRSGMFEYVFKSDSRFIRYIPPSGSSLFRAVSIEDFKEHGRYAIMPENIRLTSYKHIFIKGMHCEEPENKSWNAYLGHIANISDPMPHKDLHGTKTIFISCTTTLNGAERYMEKNLDTSQDVYIIEFKPRGLHYIDSRKTLKEKSPLFPYDEIAEDEKSISGYIDPRDIISISIYQNGKFDRKITNEERFVKG